MEEINLNPTDNAILDRLHEGRASPSYIAQKDNYSRQNVTNRLGRLVEHGYVEKLAPGLYELAEDPRSGGNNGTEVCTDGGVERELADASLGDFI